MTDVPYGFCECGCGQETNISKRTDLRKGAVEGEPCRFLAGHNLRPESLRERFWSKVNKYGPNGCWLWTASIAPNGYGHFYRGTTGGRVAHRFAYELLVGPIPEGLQLDHLCSNRGCVNPDHLEPVTAAINTRRALAKLSEEEVGTILNSDEGHVVLARRYGVSESVIQQIRIGRTYADVYRRVRGEDGPYQKARAAAKGGDHA
jgi:hypothetical protein